jgi:hypothetical protein
MRLVRWSSGFRSVPTANKSLHHKGYGEHRARPIVTSVNSVSSVVKTSSKRPGYCKSGALALAAALLLASSFAPPRPIAAQSEAPLIFSDDFEQPRMDRWQMPFPEDWVILGDAGNHYLHMKRARDPLVPRRPVQFALIKGVQVGSFDFRARARREGRSMIVVFNYVDSLHFYYTHVSMDTGAQQPVHNGIFLVNNAPRVRIAGLDAPAALPDKSWHGIRVLRDAASGQIMVWSDVQSAPLFTVTDRSFTCGQIGIGSFDETGDFDDVQLRSNDAGCSPPAVHQGH